MPERPIIVIGFDTPSLGGEANVIFYAIVRWAKILVSNHRMARWQTGGCKRAPYAVKPQATPR
jgi:hypothetical protein